MSWLFCDVGTLVHVHIATVNLIRHWLTELNNFLFQVLAYSVACSFVSAFSVGIIEAAEAEEAMNKLRTLVENNQQVIMCCLGFPSVLFFSYLFNIGYCFTQTVTSRKLD